MEKITQGEKIFHFLKQLLLPAIHRAVGRIFISRRIAERGKLAFRI
jgi:hypothetical protein